MHSNYVAGLNLELNRYVLSKGSEKFESVLRITDRERNEKLCINTTKVNTEQVNKINEN